MAGIFTYMTGTGYYWENGLKDRKIPPRGRKWKGRLKSPGKGRRSYGWNIYLHDRKLGITGKMD